MIGSLKNVLVRGWAPFGSRPSAKIDSIEHKKLFEELIKLLPDCLRNQVVVRAPFAANYQLVLGAKGGGWDQCKEVRDVLNLEAQHDGLQVRGHEVPVSVEMSPHKKVMMRNMYRGESFLRKKGVNSENYTLCTKGCKIFEQVD